MIIAELSANHGQNKDQAIALIEAAHHAGADAVKVQTYTADTLTLDSDADDFQIKDQALWKGQTLYQLYEKAYTPWEWQPELKDLAESLGMQFIASVFDDSSVDFWETNELKIYKIASAEIVHITLLQKIAKTGKRVIVSTGMATLGEIDEAVDTLKTTNPDIDLTLLKCSSAYPAPPESLNLKGIQTLADRFQCPVGLSDHTLNPETAICSVGLGATVFEKHLKLDNTETLDDAFSLTPDEFKSWAESIHIAQKTLGSPELKPSSHEASTLPFRRSLYVVKPINKGETFTRENVRSIRPAYGLHPRELDKLIGKKAKISLETGTPMKSEYIEESQ